MANNDTMNYPNYYPGLEVVDQARFDNNAPEVVPESYPETILLPPKSEYESTRSAGGQSSVGQSLVGQSGDKGLIASTAQPRRHIKRWVLLAVIVLFIIIAVVVGCVVGLKKKTDSFR